MTTPGSVTVHKTKTDLDVTCNHQGYEPGHVVAVSHFGGATAGNIIAGGVIGMGVDAASGANFYYDSPIEVLLGSATGSGGSGGPTVQLPIQLHCTAPATEGVFASEGPAGFISATIRFDINSAGDPGAVRVSQADDAVCTLTARPEIALASATFDIDSSASWTAGGKPARDIEKHVDIVETVPAGGGSKTYTFRVKAKDATEGKITLNFPVRYH